MDSKLQKLQLVSVSPQIMEICQYFQSQDFSTFKGEGNPCVQGLINGRVQLLYFVEDNSASKYYIFYVNKRKLVKVSQLKFQQCTGKYYRLRDRNIKFNDVTLSEVKTIISKIDFRSLWKGESIANGIHGFKMLIDMCVGLGKSNSIVVKFPSVIKNVLLRIGVLISKFMRLSKFSVETILELCVELFSTFLGIESVFECWKAESGGAAILAFASMFLPPSLMEVLRRISVLSNTKVLDDISQLFSVYSMILDFVNKVVEYLPFKIPERLTRILKAVCDPSSYRLLYESRKMLRQWQLNKRVMLETNFRTTLTTIHTQIKDDVGLTEWSRKSQGVKNTLEDFKNLYKSKMAYESSSRCEPSCFIYEGPPGTYKSVFMNKTIQAQKTTAYSHITKATMDGKDFYDSYNNEEIFYMDDVGQQGVSQWRNLINLVAPVKLPLECASADLKDTKFFNSEVIMMTTNCFSNLKGLCKDDGISDIHALWRRAYVFDFSKVTRVGHSLSGVLCFKHFDTRKGWLCGFPMEFQDYCKLHDISISDSVDTSGSHNFVVAWMSKIIEIFKKIKKQQFVSNELSAEDICEIDKHMNDFNGESFLNSISDSFFQVGTWLKEYVDVCLEEYLPQLFTWLKEDAFQYLVGAASVFVSLFGISRMYSCFKANSEQVELSHTVRNRHPSVELLQKQVFDCDFISPDASEVLTGVGVFSSRSLITTSHTVPEDKCFIIVYKCRASNHRIIDNLPLVCVYRNRQADVCVWNLPSSYPSPFKDISKLFKDITNRTPALLVHPRGVMDLCNIQASSISEPTKYDITVRKQPIVNSLHPSDIFYKVHNPGMCGSVVVSQSGTICGMHVAGNSREGVGAAIKYDPELVKMIGSFMSAKGVCLDAEISEKVIPDFSGIKLTDNFNVYTPKRSNFVPSPLHGTFPVTRVPAELSIYGNHTVKDISKKSFTPVQSVPMDELDFAGKVLDIYIPDFHDLGMREVIKGTEKLARLNKKSSNGLFCPKLKEDCVDFEQGNLTPKFEKDYNSFLEKVDNGQVQPRDVVWFETLKDELRSAEKVYPRSFRVSRLHFQLLTKSLFGHMVEQIVDSRDFNQIMVGVNPFKEWEKLYNMLKPYPKFAGDIKAWDGSMLPQVQHAASAVILSHYKGKFRKRAEFVLGMIPYCVVAVNDDTYLTTHSMPSGSFLTAILNSLVNRFYTGMWYYRCLKHLSPKPFNFVKDVVDLVYGDDKVNAIKNSDLQPYLNACSMRDFFISLGMDFTTSTKQSIVEPFQKWEEITFLKRKFEFHGDIGQVVGPLDLNTIFSSIAWLDSSKDCEIVLSDKLNACQRELYLHSSLYESSMNKLEAACNDRGVGFVRLPVSYLRSLYIAGEYPYEYSVGDIHTN